MSPRVKVTRTAIRSWLDKGAWHRRCANIVTISTRDDVIAAFDRPSGSAERRSSAFIR